MFHCFINLSNLKLFRLNQSKSNIRNSKQADLTQDLKLKHNFERLGLKEEGDKPSKHKLLRQRRRGHTRINSKQAKFSNAEYWTQSHLTTMETDTSLKTIKANTKMITKKLLERGK